MKPQNVIYEGITDLVILKETELYSVACFKYDGRPRYGIRWNGEGESLGTPSSHGKATWFILPDEVVDIKIKI